MSLRKGDTLIAGNVIVPSASDVRSGTSSAVQIQSGYSIEITVTFSTPMPDTDYMVDLSPTTPHGHIFTATSESKKTVNGFTFLATNTYNDPQTVAFKYTAFKLMTASVKYATPVPDWANKVLIPLSQTASDSWTAPSDRSITCSGI